MHTSLQKMPVEIQPSLLLGSLPRLRNTPFVSAADTGHGTTLPDLSPIPVHTQTPPKQIRRQCDCAGGCAKCNANPAKKRRLQAKQEPSGLVSDAADMAHQATRGSGQTLAAPVREFMESRFQRDFSQVRVHTDASAANAARAIQAKAYTIGNDIVFAPGQYQPASTEGKLLLAHELTHVVQQQGSGNMVQREATTASVPQGTRSNATARLQAVISDIEKVRSKASQQSGDAPAADAPHVAELSDFIARLRQVASSSDDNLKLQVLAGFSRPGLRQAESLQGGAVSVQQQTPVQAAAKSLEVSQPFDAAEVEADRVAHAVVNGGPAHISAQAGMHVQRQADAMAAAGFFILATEAESLPATSWNPPGWVVLGLATVVAAGLIGTSVYMSRRSERTRTAERAEPDTATSNPPPPPDLCNTAIKILTQFERLARKYNVDIAPARLAELNRLAEAGLITINHIPASIRGPFPGIFNGMTLAAIRAMCGR